MITLFNRKELLITNDMNKQAKARDTLRDAGIEYRISTFSRAGGARRGITVGMDLSRAYTYKIYVRRKDFKKAKEALK